MNHTQASHSFPFLRQRLIKLVLIALAYYATGRFGLSIPFLGSHITLFWLPTGIAVAALMRWGYSCWPGVYAGAFLVNLAVGSSFPLAAEIAIGNTLAPACTVWLLRRYHFHGAFDQQKDIPFLCLASALGMVVSAGNGVSMLWLNGVIPSQAMTSAFTSWWLGDVVGVILAAPLLLTMTRASLNEIRHRQQEFLVWGMLTALLGWIVFISADGGQSLPLAYLPLPLAVWAALRFGATGSSFATLTLALLAAIGTSMGVGPFHALPQHHGLLILWGYMVSLALAGLMVTALLAERRAVEHALQESGTRLRALFNTTAIGMVVIDEKGLIEDLNQASEILFGYSRDEVLGKNVNTLMPEPYHSQHDQYIQRYLAGGEGKVIGVGREVVGLHKSGAEFPMELYVGEVVFAKNRIFIGFAKNIAERKYAEERIERLTRLYKALSEVNQAIVRMEQQRELFPLVCRCAVEFGGMSMAWVAQPNEKHQLFSSVASYGSNLEYLDGIVISSSAEVPEGRGPIGAAFRENRSVIVNDYLMDAMTVPWKERVLTNEWYSAAAFPIRRGGKPFAVLSVYHSQLNAFDEEAIALLEEMSADISFALDNFDRDVKRKVAEESTRLAASVYEASSEAMMVTDPDNRIITINPAFTEITGYTKMDVLGKDSSILKSGRHDEDFYRAMWNDINTTGKWQGEIWNRRKSGEIYPEWLIINNVFNDDGSVLHRIALFTDISKKKESEELIWRQANLDPLTGLPNRRMFHDRLEQEIKKSHRAELPLALLFLDLDHFKEVNDTLGHAMGDVLLEKAAQRLSGCVRESDTISRFGGDEFTIILSELDDLESVDRVTESILQRISEPFQLGDEQAYVSASIGITFYPSDATEVELLLKHADQAMYAAKNAGRNGFSYFTPDMQKAAQARMRLANELRGALSDNQIWVAYQPIVDLQTGKIIKAEALARWQHPKLGLVSPADFIPVAEHTGLIIEIGDWIFQQAMRQARHWQESYYPGFQVSVNKSPVQIQDKGNRCEPWHVQLKKSGLSGSSIVAEITEGLLLEANTFTDEKLLEFRDAGIQVALDDFGTGYSSLSYLKKFDIDYIKIDQSFVRNLRPASGDMALCEAIILMAHKLGMKVIAEGIETEEQRNLLTARGCDYGQGYLFSRPVPADEFEKLLVKS